MLEMLQWAVTGVGGGGHSRGEGGRGEGEGEGRIDTGLLTFRHSFCVFQFIALASV